MSRTSTSEGRNITLTNIILARNVVLESLTVILKGVCYVRTVSDPKEDLVSSNRPLKITPFKLRDIVQYPQVTLEVAFRVGNHVPAGRELSLLASITPENVLLAVQEEIGPFQVSLHLFQKILLFRKAFNSS